MSTTHNQRRILKTRDERVSKEGYVTRDARVSREGYIFMAE